MPSIILPTTRDHRVYITGVVWMNTFRQCALTRKSTQLRDGKSHHSETCALLRSQSPHLYNEDIIIIIAITSQEFLK